MILTHHGKKFQTRENRGKDHDFLLFSVEEIDDDRIYPSRLLVGIRGSTVRWFNPVTSELEDDCMA
jgi:hypothetical protein